MASISLIKTFSREIKQDLDYHEFGDDFVAWKLDTVKTTRASGQDDEVESVDTMYGISRRDMFHTALALSMELDADAPMTAAFTSSGVRVTDMHFVSEDEREILSALPTDDELDGSYFTVRMRDPISKRGFAAGYATEEMYNDAVTNNGGNIYQYDEKSECFRGLVDADNLIPLPRPCGYGFSSSNYPDITKLVDLLRANKQVKMVKPNYSARMSQYPEVSAVFHMNRCTSGPYEVNFWWCPTVHQLRKLIKLNKKPGYFAESEVELRTNDFIPGLSDIHEKTDYYDQYGDEDY